MTPANSTVQLNGAFTLVMADAGPVGTDETQGQTRHWLVNGVTLSGVFASLLPSFHRPNALATTGSSPSTVNTTTGTAITQYAGPAPASGSGAHRSVLTVC